VSKQVVKDLKVRFISDTTQMNQQVLGNQGAFGKMKSQASGLMQKYGGLALKVGVVTSAFFALKSAMTSTVRAGIEAEDAITKLGVLFKSEAKAMDAYSKSLEFSVKTPFDPRDIVQGAVVAGQYGADAFQKGLYGMEKDAMTVIADMAAFSGQSMQEASTALFRADLQLLDKYGAQARTAYKEAKKFGELGSAGFVQHFVKAMSEVETWSGMAEKRAQTLSGLWSTIKGNVGLIWTYLSGAAEEKGVVTLWSHLKAIVKDFSDSFGAFVQEYKPFFVDMGATLGSAFHIVWDVIKGVFTILKPVFTLVMKIASLAMTIVKGVLNLGSQIIGVITPAIEKMSSALQGLLVIGSIFEFIDKAILKINQLFAFLWEGFKRLVDIIKEFFNDYIVPIFKYIGEFFNNTWDGVKKHLFGSIELKGQDVIDRSVASNNSWSSATNNTVNHQRYDNSSKTNIFNVPGALEDDDYTNMAWSAG